jgi:chemotaxis-related protein WspB
MSLYLHCRIGAEGYLLEAKRIISVLPLARIRAVMSGSPGYRGIFEFRGRSVPVIDLSERLSGFRAAIRLSTRLVIAAVGPSAATPPPASAVEWLGLIAEHATSLMRCDPQDFRPSGVTGIAAWLGPVIQADGRLLQRIECSALSGAIPPG